MKQIETNKMKVIECSIIPIYEGRAIDGEYEHEQLVNARELWEKLQVGRDFTTWIKERIEKYGFIEGQDFSPELGNIQDRGRGRPQAEYMLKLDTAKEICMIENNETGRAFRKYFIEAEKRYINLMKIKLKAKAERRTLTDIIKELVPESPHKSFVYKHYTDLVYKAVLGCNAKEYREQNNLEPNTNIRTYLTEDELRQVTRLEKGIEGLLALSLDYEQIKNFILRTAPIKGAFLMQKAAE